MPAIIHWKEDSLEKSAPWWSEKGAVQPKKVVIGGDNFSAEKVIRLASQGIAILWRGDFHNAKQLMQAIARRLDKRDRKTGSEGEKESSKIFYKYRQVRLQRARTLSAVLIPFGDDYLIPLKRAPDVREAIKQVRGLSGEGFVTPLSDLLGFISAFEWRKKGIEVSALAGLQSQRIYPHYGVFPPTRHDYVKLVADMPLPDSMESDSVAFDIGTGTGLLAAILVRRGVGRVIATDFMPRAILCAQENFEQLGISDRVDLMQTDLFPPRKAQLIICNPPWLPAHPKSSLEMAIYDPQNRMLYGFLNGLRDHLLPHGEGWLVLSDLAELLNLRTRNQLLAVIEDAGLRVVQRLDCKATHPKARDVMDPLHFARVAETTSVWRLIRN